MLDEVDWLLDHGVPVGSEEIPAQFVATGVSADSDDHIWEVLRFHYLTVEALLHHPADRNKSKGKGKVKYKGKQEERG